MKHDENGSVLDVGRKRRTIPPAIQRALDARDPTCRWPGCNVRFTQGHHAKHWAEGGETKLSNLVIEISGEEGKPKWGYAPIDWDWAIDAPLHNLDLRRKEA